MFLHVGNNSNGSISKTHKTSKDLMNTSITSINSASKKDLESQASED